MGFFDTDLGKAAAFGGGLLPGAYNLLRPRGSAQGYAPLPYENPDFAVDAGRVAQALQQGLGRAPTQNEIDQYSRYIKTGDLDYGSITQIAQGLPEADKARLEQYAQQYGSVLGANDNAYLSQAADIFGAKANSQFSSMGRPNTSAMAAQVFGRGGQLAGQMAQQRQASIANFYGQGLQSNMGAYRDQGQSALNRAYNLQDGRTAYNRGLNGYQTQRNDYNTDLANQNALNKQRALYQFGGSLAGAAIGGMAAGPGGGLAGARFGAGLGGQAGGLF